MKKTLLLLPILFFSCVSPDETESPIVPETNNFNIILAPSAVQTEVDQTISVMVTSTEDMKSIEVSTDNFVTSNSLFSDSFGSSKQFFLRFNDLGSHTISVRAKNDKNQISMQTVSINISRGPAVKINKIQVVSFKDIDNTWDPEYLDTDPNRLADVYFAFLKPQLNDIFENSINMELWYLSAVKENQGDLTWDVSSENFYINPALALRFSIADKDGALAQNLLMGFPDFRDIRFSDYSATKPGTITYSDPAIDLAVIFTIEWP